jgi:hypothetical protein
MVQQNGMLRYPMTANGGFCIFYRCISERVLGQGDYCPESTAKAFYSLGWAKYGGVTVISQNRPWNKFILGLFFPFVSLTYTYTKITCLSFRISTGITKALP